MNRVGVFINLAEHDPEATARVAALREGLNELGRNDLQLDCRYGGATPSLRRLKAVELVSLNPEVLYASTGLIVEALQDAMKEADYSIPIVFGGIIDPFGIGRVPSPAGASNATGFTSIEFSIGEKWLNLLQQIAPDLTHVAVIREPNTPAGGGQFAAIESAASSAGVELSPIDARDAGEIDRGITAVVGQPGGGLIVTAGTWSGMHRDLIINLAAQHLLPAVYPSRGYATSGGLIVYGVDQVELYRSAASYIDRILGGEKAGDLPIQPPRKYELVINLKTAKAQGIDVPPSLLAKADLLIE